MIRDPWSSLVEGDEQLDRAKTVKHVEWNIAMHTQDNFMPSVKKHNSLSLGPMYSFHLLLLKSSLWDQTVLCLNVVVPQRQNNLLKMNL